MNNNQRPYHEESYAQRRPIYKDEPRAILASDGTPIYKHTKSVFGVQKRTVQIPIGYNLGMAKQTKKVKANDDPVKEKSIFDETDQMLINWYFYEGYDPWDIYEPKEKEYQNAVRVLTPIDIELGKKVNK